MIRHIVMFKLREFQTPAEKQAKMQEIKDKLEALINKIDVLKMIRVDFNCNPAETWDIILTTELPTRTMSKTLNSSPPKSAKPLKTHRFPKPMKPNPQERSPK